jgi:hypothetical protein
MSERQSQRSVASSARHRQEAELAAAEERERVAAETATTVARASRLAAAELATARAEVEVAAVADAARAAVVELKALCGSSISSSASADDDTDVELKQAREAAGEWVAQWAAAHPHGCGGGSPDGRGRAGNTSGKDARGHAPGYAAGSTEIVDLTGGAAHPPRTGAMVTIGSRRLSGTLAPAVGGLPSPRPTLSSGCHTRFPRA